MRLAALWPFLTGLLLVGIYLNLDRTPPVRASFQLTGTVDCGRSSGAACTFDGTIVIISKDSGSPVKYTIDITWLKSLPSLDQDDFVTIEIEKLPNGTLQALNLTDISGQEGTSNPGTRGARSTTTTLNDDDNTANVACTDTVVTTTSGTGSDVQTLVTTVFSTTVTTVTDIDTDTSTSTIVGLDPFDLLALVGLSEGDGYRQVRIPMLQACDVTTATVSENLTLVTETSVTTTTTTTSTTTTVITTIAE